MKKYLLTAGALLLWSGTALAGGADTVTMPANTYKAIMDRLDALQKRVDMLEESGKAAPAPAPAAVTREEYDKLSGDIDNIYDTLDVVETKALKDRINWGAELRTRVDNYQEFPAN
jgi:transaldolase